MKNAVPSLLTALTLTLASSASAQDEPPPVDEVGDTGDVIDEEGAVEAPPAETEAAAETAPAAEEEDSSTPKDGARFRFGVAGGVGPLFLEGITAFYGGVDLRFGAQINDLVGVYLQPQLGGYGADVGGVTGSGGLVGFTGIVDFTLSDRFFVGGGAGWAVLNSPSGAAIHLRAGGYPLMSRHKEKARRKGLMVGLDFRIHIVSNGLSSATGVAPTVNIGYEAF